MNDTSRTSARIMTFGAGFLPCPLMGGRSTHLSRCLKCPDAVDFGPVVDNLPTYVVCHPSAQHAAEREPVRSAVG
ncbi:MAG TPA: hypothetical protein VGA69_08715 [Nitriliruptorales bacterium]